jgi:RNA polymerase sigma factor (TIGR02999 family)
MGDLTAILGAMQRGDSAAAEQLLPLVYEELRRIAAQKMAREMPGQTLQPTALVHEAWLKLGGDQQPVWQNRAHFFSAAAEAMRRILIDRARKRQVRAASGLNAPEELSESRIEQRIPDADLIAVHELVDRLSGIDGDAARLVKLRYFVGLSMSETADALGISQRQAERLWTFGKAWLRDAIQRER